MFMDILQQQQKEMNKFAMTAFGQADGLQLVIHRVLFSIGLTKFIICIWVLVCYVLHKLETP